MAKHHNLVLFDLLIYCILISMLMIIFNGAFVINAEENIVISNQDIKYRDWERDRELSDVKNVISIEGESLVCFEYVPTGYAIYDINGELWERCADADSPYKDFNDDFLIYGGPTQYYKEIDSDTLLNTYTKSEKNITEEERKVLYKTKFLDSEVKRNIADRNLYFDGGIIGYNTVGGVLSSTNTSGLNQGTSCGGVAAALVLHYFDIKYPSKNINSDDDCKSLYRKLKQYGDVRNSTADTIKPIVKKYLADNGGDCLIHTTLLGTFTTNKYMTEQIDKGNPVILFAAVANPSESGDKTILHAIVAHTYHERLGALGTRKYSYVCHFGWGPTYNNVEIHNAIKYITVGTSYVMGVK